jgi:hypothetical protein
LTFALAWGGSAGRFVTCMIESSDLMFNLVSIVSFSLYSILMCQFLLYWTPKQLVSPAQEKKSPVKERRLSPVKNKRLSPVKETKKTK